jgi:hypothetical protein
MLNEDTGGRRELAFECGILKNGGYVEVGMSARRVRLLGGEMGCAFS